MPSNQGFGKNLTGTLHPLEMESGAWSVVVDILSQDALLGNAFYGAVAFMGALKTFAVFPRSLAALVSSCHKTKQNRTKNKNKQQKHSWIFNGKNRGKEGKAPQDRSLLQLHEMPRHPFTPCILPVLGFGSSVGGGGTLHMNSGRNTPGWLLARSPGGSVGRQRQQLRAATGSGDWWVLQHWPQQR